jgi:hypothetical protein
MWKKQAPIGSVCDVPQVLGQNALIQDRVVAVKTIEKEESSGTYFEGHFHVSKRGMHKLPCTSSHAQAPMHKLPCAIQA